MPQKDYSINANTYLQFYNAKARIGLELKTTVLLNQTVLKIITDNLCRLETNTFRRRYKTPPARFAF
jgi:hypothetical protein